MASNGSVVAESNQDSVENSAETTVPSSSAHPKPEVARKPHLPGNKPRPPVPKKPPVAHKPAPSENHGNTAPPSTPASLPNTCNSDSTSPTASVKLSPSTHSHSHTQGAALAGNTHNAGKKTGVKSPPPPLPKSPPKGTPQAGSRGKDPPPRPAQLPTARKTAPPVPAKRPVGRKPVQSIACEKSAGQDNTDQSLTEQKQLRSYEQVVVEENLKGGTGDGQPAGLDDSSPGAVRSPSPRPRAYQQVVVEESSGNSVESDCKPVVLNRNRSSPLHRPQSYENVGLKTESQTSSQQASASGSARSYEEVVVEENAETGAEAGVCVVEAGDVSVAAAANQEESDQNKSEENNDKTKDQADSLASEEDSGAENLSASSDVINRNTPQAGESENLLTTGNHGDSNTEFCENKIVPPTESATEIKASSNKHEKNSELGQSCVNAEDNLAHPAENSSKRSPSRPSPTPPPVRPKPRKRVSLLRQSVVTDEEPGEPNPPLTSVSPAATPASSESTDTHNLKDLTPQPETAETIVEEAVYQEIDELEQSDQKLTESCSSCGTESSLDSKTAENLSEVKVAVQDDKSGSEERKPAQEKVKGDAASGLCESGSETKVGNNSELLQEAGTETPPEPQISDKHTTELESKTPQATEKDTTDTQEVTSQETSRKSPEKEESITLQDVGETSFMLKEIEQLLNARLGTGDPAEETEPKPAEASDAPASGHTDTPLRPPRPRRADRLRKLTIGSCSADNSSTESLTSVGLSSGKKAPPKPKRKHLPGLVSRSLSDVTGMKNVIDQLTNDDKEEEEEEKPFLPPRQQSLRFNSEPKPPPLPPRNKSMERTPDVQGVPGSKSSDGLVKQGEQVTDRRGSAPNVGAVTPTKVVRSASGAQHGKKRAPRPTRKAPPPPPHPPASRPLSMLPPESSGSGTTPSTSASGEKVPGYQKITNGVVSASEDIKTVVPKTAVVGSLDSPGPEDVSIDHDYHEIPDHLVKNLTQSQKVTEQKQKSSVELKEETPPPELPPRSYKPPPGEPTAAKGTDLPKEESSDKTSLSDTTPGTDHPQQADSETGLVKTDLEAETSTPQDKSDQLSAEDSESQSSQLSSRPESFCSEVMGSLLHVVGDRQRPMSVHSSSSHSETGSGELEVPTFDHSSGSESENEDDEDKMKQKREKKVYLIAEEVVKSEKVFVDVLKLLNVDFRVFMSSKTEQAGHPIVPSETLNKILDFLPQLQSFNEMLLKDLTDRIANWEKQKKISDVFVKKGPFLKLYSSYIRNFEHATALLDETCKKHGGFGQALQQFEMSSRCANLALKHYMLKPIQRIPQYKLLLQDYLKHLPPESPDYKDTITALNIVSEVADHANESMRHGDNVQKLLEIQRSLIGQFEVIQPGRVLIKQGELMKLSRKEMQPRMFFLFSDVLLYTTPTATGYRLNNILPLQGMKVLPPKLEEFKNEFNIISTQRSFTVATNTPEEREEWLRALWNAIEENSERYHTFKAMQPEPKTSLLDKDFVLGTKAPLWVPDARVTMCMLCLAEFSITWRRHHCRACGRIICGNCSENKAPLRYLMYKPARVCDECYEKLVKEVDRLEQAQQKPTTDNSCTSPTTDTTASTTATPTVTVSPPATPADSASLSFSSIKARFQKIRKSARERKKAGLSRPSVLKEVHANDEGSDMSGYLFVAKNKKWKRLWFVVKGKVLYTYKASEDMAAIESMPLLGFEVTRMTSWYQGAEPDLMFELQHQNTQPLVFKPRSASTSSSERSSIVDDSKVPSPTTLSPHVKSSADTTTPRLIFRTDSAAATTKWLTVLREASLA